MAAEDEKVLCPVCEHEVGTKENGTRIKAHKVSGEKCDGSDELIETDAGKTEGIDKGASYEPQDSAQGDENDSDAQNDDETPKEPETGTQGVASSDVKEFVHTFSIQKPCPHVHQSDRAWHTANVKMVDKLARKAGHVPTAEPHHAGNEETASHVLVTYAVPVK